jgi:hypothetical protein
VGTLYVLQEAREFLSRALGSLVGPGLAFELGDHVGQTVEYRPSAAPRVSPITGGTEFFQNSGDPHHLAFAQRIS